MELIKKLVGCIFATATILVLSSNFVLAEDTLAATSVKEIDSYELFWPMVAGKTMKDSIFPLKLFKENFQALFVFKSAPKSEYHLVLATKRFLELEKLISDKENLLSSKTLDKALKQLSVFRKNLKLSENSKTITSNRRAEIKNKLENLKVFLPQLAIKGESGLVDRINDAKSLVDQSLKDLN